MEENLLRIQYVRIKAGWQVTSSVKTLRVIPLKENLYAVMYISYFLTISTFI
jgi:hypothetical protein